jgi:hypothetical protein
MSGGKYRIEEELAVGGWEPVFRVTHLLSVPC